MELELGVKIEHPAQDIPFDSVETETAFALLLHLPGLGREGIEIKLIEDARELRIRGGGGGFVREHILARRVRLRREEEVGGFFKAFRVPEGVDMEAVEATYDENDGILVVYLPKLAPGRSVSGVTIGEIEQGKEREKAEENPPKGEEEDEDDTMTPAEAVPPQELDPEPEPNINPLPPPPPKPQEAVVAVIPVPLPSEPQETAVKIVPTPLPSEEQGSEPEVGSVPTPPSREDEGCYPEVEIVSNPVPSQKDPEAVIDTNRFPPPRQDPEPELKIARSPQPLGDPEPNPELEIVQSPPSPEYPEAELQITPVPPRKKPSKADIELAPTPPPSASPAREPEAELEISPATAPEKYPETEQEPEIDIAQIPLPRGNPSEQKSEPEIDVAQTPAVIGHDPGILVPEEPRDAVQAPPVSLVVPEDAPEPRIEDERIEEEGREEMVQLPADEGEDERGGEATGWRRRRWWRGRRPERLPFCTPLTVAGSAFFFVVALALHVLRERSRRRTR